MGILMQKVINWIKLEYDGLYSVLLISMVLITLSVSEFMGGNPYLAIYISGCILGNRDFVHKKSLMKHFDGQAWLMQIVMFLTLGLLVFPKQIVPYIGIGLIFSFILIFVARPLSVFILLSFFKINFRKKLFISWVGIRGAVPIILAIFPLTTGIDKANIIFNLVFFVSVTSVLVQGTSIPLVANWLHLAVPVDRVRKSEFDMEMAWKTKSINKSITIGEPAKCIGRSIVELGLPGNIIIALIERNDKFIVPEGTTQLRKGDRLTILADSESEIDRLQTEWQQANNPG
jgi:cell volume regulation protein A